jgi:hypothetical protein
VNSATVAPLASVTRGCVMRAITCRLVTMRPSRDTTKPLPEPAPSSEITTTAGATRAISAESS